MQSVKSSHLRKQELDSLLEEYGVPREPDEDVPSNSNVEDIESIQPGLWTDEENDREVKK